MKITVLANPTSDDRILYRADWKEGRAKKVNYVCISRQFFDERAKEKGWVL